MVWFTDNQSVTTIVTSGSKVCVAHGIKLDIQWIPRDLNYVTDELSKIADFDDYTLHDQVFNYIDTIWGPHSCDRLLVTTMLNFRG